MPSSPRRHAQSHTTRYLDDDSNDDGHDRRDSRSSRRPRGFDRTDSPRNNSLVRREKEVEDHHDSQWDTDYDPKDKYYLSADEDPFDLYDARSKVIKSSTRSRKEESVSRDRDNSSNHHHSSSRNDKSHSHSKYRHHHSTEELDDSPERRHASTTQSKPNNTTSPRPRASRPSSSYVASSRARPRPVRATSSYLSNIRPRVARATSSYLGTHARPGIIHSTSHSRSSRPRGASRQLSTNTSRRKQPNKSVKTGSNSVHDFPWREAGLAAMQAGTVAAIKVGAGPGTWESKGVKVASAAIGAAVVDHVIKPKKKGGIKYSATRYLAELAVGNLVAGPLVGNMRSAGKSSGRGGGRRR